MRVVRVDPVSEEVVYELLGQAAHLHICIHVQVLHLEPVRLHHLADGDHIRMHLSPGKRLDSHIQIVGTGTRHLQHRSRRETRACVAVVLYLYMRVSLLY